jgi:hypothetical protein
MQAKQRELSPMQRTNASKFAGVQKAGVAAVREPAQPGREWYAGNASELSDQGIYRP